MSLIVSGIGSISKIDIPQERYILKFKSYFNLQFKFSYVYMDFFNVLPEINSKVNNCTYEEYTKKFEELIVSEYKYFESKNHHGQILKHVYNHKFKFDSLKVYFHRFGEIRSPKYLLREWIEIYFEPCFYDQHIKFAYKYVKIRELKLYILFIKICYQHGIFCRNDLPYRLMLIHQKTPNLTFEEFVLKYHKFFRESDFSIYVMIEEFEEIIKVENNKKISELWWIWRDFTGEYNSYIEWLPRETLDDLLMVANSGKYQPDYTTYVE